MKFLESLKSVVPITVLVLILNFTIINIPRLYIVIFIIGSVMLALGSGLFTLGVDISMIPMGEKIGAYLTSSRNILLLIFVYFFIGIVITIAEPDLQVLAKQVPAIPNHILILTVAVGVGLFLTISMLRIIFQFKLKYIIIFFYLIIFILAIFSDKDFLSVSFDSGGVTTGPITVPFILALGIGMAIVRGDSHFEEDSFGLVSICSIGPILSVLLLGVFFDVSDSGYYEMETNSIQSIKEIVILLISELRVYGKEVFVALLPIVALLIIFQVFKFRFKRRKILRIAMGILYTYLGLVIFLTAANVAFVPVASYIGMELGNVSYKLIIIPVGMIIGYFIVRAEPAVQVLNEQVEEITGGTISEKIIKLSLSIGMALSVGISMIRIMTSLPIWIFLVVGYGIAIILTFFVPPIFTAIAFDSGGVASGPMTVTFLLPMAMGLCHVIGGNIITDAFGIVAMVAMTPLITIQVVGLVYKFKIKQFIKEEMKDEKDEKEIIEYDQE